MIGKSLGLMYRGEKPIETALLPMGPLDNLVRITRWISAYDGDLPDPENRVTVTGLATDLELHTEQPGGPTEAVRQAQIDAGSAGHAPASSDSKCHTAQDRDLRRLRPSGWNMPVRSRSQNSVPT
jgi:hypothetical protein